MIFLILFIVIIILDQWTKHLAEKNLKHGESKPILGNTVTLTLHKNKGAALNLLENHPKFIRIVTVPAILFLIIYLLKMIKNKGFVLTKIAIAFIAGGGAGNLIDRIKKGYVVDFFHFNFKKCPIFNLSDIFIILGTILLQFLFLFKKTPID
ncbi:MAG: signal peptidase II [Epulopiscium sp.]|nr:signal peptidase II [Candidatus Epulonipiscium sp.]